jgi:hypothetical protein
LDPSQTDTPVITNGLIAATGCCVAVGTLMELDGETEILLGESSAVDPHEALIFDAPLPTPTLRLSVQTVDVRTVLEAMVPTASTRVRVWVNHPSEPDQIWIGFEPAE